MPVNSLTLRLVKGSGLTVAEMDGNFITLRDFVNGLEQLFFVTHNADGTVKLLTVTSAMLGNASVTTAKIGLLAVGAAQISDQAITAPKLDNAIAGPGLAKAANGDPLSVRVDGATLILDGGVLKLGTAQPGNLDPSIPFRLSQTLTGGTLGTTLPANPPSNLFIAHSLGSVPAFARGVVVCKASDGPFSVGDEVEYHRVMLRSNLLQNGIVMVARADSIQFGVRADAANAFNILSPTDGAPQNITSANWQLKVYVAA